MYICKRNMMLELHNVTIGPHIRGLSLTIEDGQVCSLSGGHGIGKSLLLRAILGFVPFDAGHVCIDGELLTTRSIPYYRRYTAYVPQQLTVPEGYGKVPTDYLSLLRLAVGSGKPLLLVDEPPSPLTEDEQSVADALIMETAGKGTTVLAISSRVGDFQVQL